MFHVNRLVTKFRLIDILKLDSRSREREYVLPRGGVNYLAQRKKPGRKNTKVHFETIDFETTVGCEWSLFFATRTIARVFFWSFYEKYWGYLKSDTPPPGYKPDPPTLASYISPPQFFPPLNIAFTVHVWSQRALFCNDISSISVWSVFSTRKLHVQREFLKYNCKPVSSTTSLFSLSPTQLEIVIHEEQK